MAQIRLFRLISRSVPLWLAAFVYFIVLVALPSAQAQTNVNVNGTVPSRVSASVSTFEADRASLLADGVTTVTLEATILDVNSEPLPGRQVVVTSNRGLLDLIRCYNGPILTTNSYGTTDVDGRVVCVVSSTTVGSATFTAVAEGVELDDNPVVNFEEVPGVPPPPPPPPPPEPEPTPTPPPGTPPTEPAPPAPILPKPPGTVQRIINRVERILDDLPPIVPGGVGLAVLLPTVALLVPLGSGISASVMAGIPALQYLFLSSIPSFRPPKKWGVVLDVTTRVPIPGIFVSLVDVASNTIIKRVMTDRTGRFGFLNPASGRYRVEIKNPLYHPFTTEPFETSGMKDEAISFTIYLQALEAARIEALHKTAYYMKFLKFIQITQLTFLIGGSLLAIALFAREQITENILLLILYALLWVLKFISSLSYSQSGHIIERATDDAVHEAVVQVTSMRKGQQELVHSTITDEAGRFLVLVPPGKYNVIAAKEGFGPAEKQVSGEIQNIEMNLERLEEPPADGVQIPSSLPTTI